MSLIPFANRWIVWCSSLQASQHSSIPHREIPLRFRERAGAVPRTGRPALENEEEFHDGEYTNVVRLGERNTALPGDSRTELNSWSDGNNKKGRFTMCYDFQGQSDFQQVVPARTRENRHVLSPLLFPCFKQPALSPVAFLRSMHWNTTRARDFQIQLLSSSSSS